jgi:hypothetical protein
MCLPAIRTTISSRCHRSLDRGPPLAQSSRNRGTEFEHPAPDRFVGQVEPAFGKQFLDVAVAQGEAEIEPNCVLDDARREAVPAGTRAISCSSITHTGAQGRHHRDNASCTA